MKVFRIPVSVAVLFAFGATGAHGQTPARSAATVSPVATPIAPGDCPRPAIGSTVAEPADIRSQNGELHVALTFHQSTDPNGSARFCYLSEDGSQAPTVRVKPGDLVVITLKNEISPHANLAPAVPAGKSAGSSMPTMNHAGPMPDACAGGGEMSITATNIHFHGLFIPATCHADDVLKTSILPGEPAFEYRFRIPAGQPPGLYWYHPHMHGFSKVQVLGGASAALIVEGIERAVPELAGLPERVFVIRDQDLLFPNAEPAKNGMVMPPVVLDADGDVRNTGNGTGKPAKDLSVNFVPVPYPDYQPAVIQMKPGERQLWRVLNASAITYLNFQLLYENHLTGMAVVALDGIPLNYNGRGKGIVQQNHLGLPPGGRAEFIVTAPAAGMLTWVTRSVNTGSGGENDPVRPIANIVVSPDAPEPRSHLAVNPGSPLRPALPWLGDVTPVRTRKLFFSETLLDPKDPNSPTTFYITVDGQQPAVFDPNSNVPNIVAHQGDVEDWIIENRSQELHAFHIHQIHFLLIEWWGIPVNEPFLRDTLNVPFWDGKSPKYPSITVRMDFRNPDAVGTFPYHCHLLEHEDGGMMGLIRVEPAENSQSVPAAPVPASTSASARVQPH